MKKITLAIFIALFTFASFAQPKAKKPTIMIVPSDVWCNQNGFMQEFNNQGTVVKVPDYKKAMQSDPTLIQVIAQINGMMAERGFPLKNLESALKTLEAEAADDNMRSSSTTGGGVSSSPTDKLKQVAKADIWMQITYNVNKKGPKSSIQFTLQGLDAYTDKQVATATGNGEPSSGSTPELMQEAVLAHLDNFNSTLMTYFEDMFVNGREVVCRIKVWDDWGENLETEEYGDDELGILIEGWMSELTVNEVFNLTTSTENQMFFEQVRIPMWVIDAKGKEKAYDVRALGKDLRKKLKTVGVEAKAENDGLGKVTLWIGHK
ncbi:MAG: DUF6175 family protein [Proteobacteria bacterium]|nr:DUF6175 family protein [Pseudomonadota bacterium]